MEKRLYDCLEISDLKDMLNKTKNLYAENPAYKIRLDNGKYKIFTHGEVRNMVDSLGTALINLGLKGKRIAIIGENRYEWEIAYLSIYSQEELIENGRKLIEQGHREFIDAKINPEEMNIMLCTSGTTSKSKVVALSHKNICSNLMDIGSVLDINSNDTLLSILPIHHVFECTVGFLFSLKKIKKIIDKCVLANV